MDYLLEFFASFLEIPFVSPFLIGGGILLGLIILLNIIRRILRMQSLLPYSFQKVVLLLTVPKIPLKKEKEEKPPQEAIGIAETLFSTLGGLYPQKGLKAFLFGRNDHFSFEIVAEKDGLISFYIVVPRYLQQFLEHQVHAQYPEAHLEEVEDYNIFSPQGEVLGTYLVLAKKFIFPIKTYKKIESDPLNALTNALSKVPKGSGAAIQIVARSAHQSWHKYPARVASQIQQGKKIEEALKGESFWGKLSGIGKYIFPKTFEKKQEEYYKRQYEYEPYRLSPMEEEVVKALEEKTSKAGFDVNIRIVTSAPTKEEAERQLNLIVDSFSQYYGYEYLNGFVKAKYFSLKKLIHDFIYRNFDPKKQFILNTEEMASLFHPPLPSTETPNIRWLLARTAPAPANIPKEGIVLGHNVFRGIDRVIRIKKDDRRRHIYIIGQTGVGKSALLLNMVVQDIKNGEGVGVIDPHGDLIEEVLGLIPSERADDVVYFNPSDMERPIGLNMLEAKTEEEKDFAVQEMIAIFYKLFPPEIIGPMFEHNMRNVMLTLMADPKNPGTIAEIPRMFSDPDFQKAWYKKVTDPVVRAFWEKEMARTTDFHKSEMLGYLISKVGRFVENIMMRNIIGQSHSGIDFSKVMDEGKILLVNLSKGTTGEVNSALLGLIIVSKLQMAAMRRASRPMSERRDFFLYIDEFQNFVTDSIATILSEARKYRLNLAISHQYIGQLVQGQDTKIKDAVFGNVGTKIAFRVGVEDAETIAKEFAPVFDEYDVMNVPMYTANVKLLIDNTASKPFTMKTYPPLKGDPKVAQAIKQLSRLKYGRDRKLVEAEILERSRLGEPSTRQSSPLGEKNL